MVVLNMAGEVCVYVCVLFTVGVRQAVCIPTLCPCLHLTDSPGLAGTV